MNFQKTVENFDCEKCGTLVSGGGYTNHCPNCLWSKHVDVNPGDRAANCGGLMHPIEVRKEGEEYSIIHQCEICSHSKKNKVSPNDNFNEVVKLASSARPL